MEETSNTVPASAADRDREFWPRALCVVLWVFVVGGICVSTAGTALICNTGVGRAIIYSARGAIHSAGKHTALAISDYTQAIADKPDFALAYRDRGRIYSDTGDYPAASIDLAEAVRLAPKDSVGCNGLAWFLATCPVAQLRNGNRAVALATTACTLDHYRWSSVDTLAAAYAEIGQFDRAVKWQRRAINARWVPADYYQGMKDRLLLYQRKMPYRLSDSPVR